MTAISALTTSLPSSDPAPSGTDVDRFTYERRFAVLTQVLMQTSGRTGMDVFAHFAQALSETLGAKRAHISQILPDQPERLQMLAHLRGEEVVANESFEIKGTASEQVLLHGPQCLWDELATLLPHNRESYEIWGISTYLGTPLIDSKGKVIGVIAVMFGPGSHDRVLAETVLRLFAIRASSEMERVLVEESRRRLEETFQAVVRGTTSVYGEAFFNALVIELSRAFRARCVYLTRISPVSTERLSILAGVENGVVTPPAETGLRPNSPTRDTIIAGFLYVPHSLLKRYDDNPSVVERGEDTYLGIALRNARGEMFGAITLFGLEPISDVSLARSMLAVFAARVSAEIQRIEADAAVARIDDQLRHTQKLEALGTLAGGIAHDFNNILTGILGNTQLADFAADKPDTVRHHLGQVLQGCRRARDLIARILTFSRQHDQPRTSCALVSVVREAVDFMATSLPRNITVRAHYPAEERFILADAGQIHQAMLNLGTNAIHALTPRGGTITVEIATLAANDPLRAKHPQIRAEHTLCLIVADDGPGIPPALHERIFEPFFTTKPVGQGTGLGLSTVHGIVRSFGGVIALASQPGQGTRFHLCFPTNATKAPSADPFHEVPVAIPAQPQRRLLFVDDDAVITKLAAIALKPFGWTVTTHNDPSLALARFEHDPTAFEAVVTDLSMPHMNGAELALAIHKIRPELPVIIITGYMRSEEVEIARQAGVKHFLPKPFTIESLTKILKTAG
jgi:signal transduction histidine kinase/CheY-like chemotaxis protein